MELKRFVTSFESELRGLKSSLLSSIRKAFLCTRRTEIDVQLPREIHAPRK